MGLLLSDNAFDEISRISNDAFDLALKAYRDGILIPKEDAQKYIEVITSALKKFMKTIK